MSGEWLINTQHSLFFLSFSLWMLWIIIYHRELESGHSFSIQHLFSLIFQWMTTLSLYYIHTSLFTLISEIFQRSDVCEIIRNEIHCMTHPLSLIFYLNHAVNHTHTHSFSIFKNLFIEEWVWILRDLFILFITHLLSLLSHLSLNNEENEVLCHSSPNLQIISEIF